MGFFSESNCFRHRINFLLCLIEMVSHSVWNASHYVSSVENVCWETNWSYLLCNSVWGTLSRHESFLVTRQGKLGIHLFYKQDITSDRRGHSLFIIDAHGSSSFYQSCEAVSSFHLFAVWAFLHVTRTHCDSFIAWGGNLVSLLECWRVEF